jgi:D-glycero-alpha-D-manno-heptose-7-phosphate kinase
MIITKTPLRISFVGGGTDMRDYYGRDGGAVVSAGINKYIYITVNPKFDHQIRVSYSKTEIVPEVEDLHHEIVKASLQMVGIRHGVEITSIADIPAGTGLGSSSTFTVGLLNALYSYVGQTLSSEELAQRACKVEIEILGHPIGKQDQYAAAYGGLNFFTFNFDETVSRKRIWLSDIDIRRMTSTLMLFYTGLGHDANQILAEQKDNTEDKRAVMDFMKNQAYQMAGVLENQGFTEYFAEALRIGWEKKQSLASGISNPKIAEWYEAAMNAGAKGGKLLGAGGGGFLLFYVDMEKQDVVRQAIGLQEVDFHVTRYGSRVVYFD